MTTTWLRDPQYDGALDELAALQVQQSRTYAAQARVLARLASRTTRDGWQGNAPFDSLVLDVSGTCHLGQVAAGSRLTDGEHLVLRLPGVLAELEVGRLRVHQAQVLVGETRALEPRVCAEVERRVLPAAPALCPADLKRLIRRVVLEVDAPAVAHREAEAVRERRTWVQPAADGMGLFCALLPAEKAQQVQARLTEQARQMRAAGDPRSMDQLRADLLVKDGIARDGGGPQQGEPCFGVGPGRVGARPVRVVVHVPLAVALGLSDQAADLEGYGPLSAAHARRLAVGADLVRACVDEDGRVVVLEEAPSAAAAAEPDPGEVPPGATLRARLALADALRDLARRPPPPPRAPEPQHDPSAPLARLVRARDARCDGPGCSMPASRCELDHDVPWPQGETSADNLVARSQRCHHAKHAGWTAERNADGTAWTSPGHRRYLVPHRRTLGRPSPDASVRGRRAVALHRAGHHLVALVELGLPAAAGVAARSPAPGGSPAIAEGGPSSRGGSGNGSGRSAQTSDPSPRDPVPDLSPEHLREPGAGAPPPF